MTKEGHTQSVNFMTPRAGVLMIGHGHTRLTLKMHYKSILYSQTWIRQTKCIVITTREGSTKIVYFTTPGRDHWARAWPCKSYSEYELSSTASIYSTSIMIATQYQQNILRNYNAALLCLRWFLIFWCEPSARVR